MIKKVNKFVMISNKNNNETILDTEEELNSRIEMFKEIGITEDNFTILTREFEIEVADKNEKEYEICDLNKGMFSDNKIVFAKTPLEACKKYIKSIGEDKKIKRDMTNSGRLVVRNNRASYVYHVI